MIALVALPLEAGERHEAARVLRDLDGFQDDVPRQAAVRAAHGQSADRLHVLGERSEVQERPTTCEGESLMEQARVLVEVDHAAVAGARCVQMTVEVAPVDARRGRLGEHAHGIAAPGHAELEVDDNPLQAGGAEGHVPDAVPVVGTVEHELGLQLGLGIGGGDRQACAAVHSGVRECRPFAPPLLLNENGIRHDLADDDLGRRLDEDPRLVHLEDRIAPCLRSHEEGIGDHREPTDDAQTRDQRW